MDVLLVMVVFSGTMFVIRKTFCCPRLSLPLSFSGMYVFGYPILLGFNMIIYKLLFNGLYIYVSTFLFLE